MAKRIILVSLAAGIAMYYAWLGIAVIIERVHGENVSLGISKETLSEYDRYSVKRKLEILRANDVGDQASAYMMSRIARHGASAYEELLPFLKGEAQGLRLEMVGRTMHLIHQWGFNLKGSEAHSILSEISKRPGARYWVQAAVRDIENERAGALRESLEESDRYVLDTLLQETK